MSSKKKQSSHIFDILRSEFGMPDFGQREFKSAVAKLKKLGLVSKKTDARKQKPTRYMRNIVRQFADVLKGEAQVFTIPTKEAPIYQASGVRVKKHAKTSKAVVTAPKTAKVARSKTTDGIPHYKVSMPSPNGGPGVTVEYPLILADTEAKARLAAYVAKLPKLKKGQFYVFRFDGYMSGQTFSGENAKKHMLEYFTRYKIRDENDPDDYVMRFEIVTIEDKEAWRSGYQQQRRESESRNQQRNKERYNEWRRRKYAQMDELERRESRVRSEKTRTRDAQYHKNKRAARTPEQIEADKLASKNRMRKSRANRKQ